MVAVREVRKHEGQPQAVSLLKSSQVIEGIAGMLGQAGGDIPVSPSAALLSLMDSLARCRSPCSQPTAGRALLPGLAKKVTLQEGR